MRLFPAARRLATILVWSSGADPYLVDRLPSSQRGIYVALGAEVLLSAAFAASCMGSALGAAGLDLLSSTLGGMFAAGLLLSLDRVMMGGILGRGSFVPAVLRLLMALLMAIVYSQILELVLFRDAVTRHVGQTRAVAIQGVEESLSVRRGELQGLELRLSQLQEELTLARNAYLKSLDTVAGRRSGVEPVPDPARERYIVLRDEWERTQGPVNDRIAHLRRELVELGERRVALDQSNSRPGLLEQFAALRSLTADIPVTRSLGSLLFTLTFLTLASPVLTTMLAPRSLYHELLREEIRLHTPRSVLVGEDTRELEELVQSAFRLAIRDSSLNSRVLGTGLREGEAVLS